jgi:ferrous iron transport protein B
VIVFVPQIAILFLFLAVLEDSGYLARAAFLMDRVLSRVGLHGKSFIPLLSGFACAIPGIMATRTIEHRKGRLATILVVPFMTCSARLPVYALLVGTFFAGAGALGQAGILLSLYVLGILFAMAAAFFFRRTLLKGNETGFILELPSYKVPQLSLVGRQMWSNSAKFLSRAGTTIVCICLGLWAISYYPRLPRAEAARWSEPNARAAAQQAYSAAGRLGRAIEPGIRPLGFDWKMGVGCIGAFAAREVFVSTMAIVYGTDAREDGARNLGAAMRDDRYPNGRPVWTPLVAASLLLWFVLAMQCMSTVMVVRQETGGWKWPLFMVGYMNALAYAACFAFYQIGSRLLGG